MARFVVMAVAAMVAYGAEMKTTGDAMAAVTEILQKSLDKATKNLKDLQVSEEARREAFRLRKESLEQAIAKAASETEAFMAQAEQGASKAVHHKGLAAAQRKEIVKLEAEKAKNEKELKNYMAEARKTQKDLAESVSALKRAVEVIGADKAKNTFVQLQALHRDMPTMNGKVAVESMLERNTYDGQGGQVLDMLKDLKSEFEDELFKSEKASANFETNASMQIQQLTNLIEETTDQANYNDMESKKNAAAGKEAKANAADSHQQMEDDQDALQNAENENAKNTRDAKLKTVEYTSTIAADEGAIKELASAFIQEGISLIEKRNSFLQVGMTNPKVQRIVELLDARAVQFHSKTLSALAVRVTADPFKKIKEMIEDLVQRLNEEAAEEAEQHGWCVAEMDSNKQIRDAKTTETERLMASVDASSAKIAQFKGSIADVQEMLSNLVSDREKQTKIRAEDKATNTNTIETAQNGLTQLTKAIAIIKKGAATASAAAGATSGGSTATATSATDAIITLLGTIKKDFTTLKTDFEGHEESDQSTFDGYLDRTAIEEAKAKTNLQNFQAKVKAEKKKRDTTNVDLAATKGELEAAQKQFEDLKPVCAPPPVDLAERQRQRDAEIQSLKEVQSILEEK